MLLYLKALMLSLMGCIPNGLSWDSMPVAAHTSLVSEELGKCDRPEGRHTHRVSGTVSRLEGRSLTSAGSSVGVASIR